MKTEQNLYFTTETYIKKLRKGIAMLSMHMKSFKRVMNNERDIHIHRKIFENCVSHSFRELIVHFHKHYTLGKNSDLD